MSRNHSESHFLQNLGSGYVRRLLESAFKPWPGKVMPTRFLREIFGSEDFRLMKKHKCIIVEGKNSRLPALNY
jgi:hypothetical protein